MEEEKHSITLERLLDLHLQPLIVEIKSLKSAFEKISVSTISYNEFKKLEQRIAKLEENCHMFDDRLEQLEFHDKIGRWVLGIIVSIIMALTITALQAYL